MMQSRGGVAQQVRTVLLSHSPSVAVHVGRLPHVVLRLAGRREKGEQPSFLRRSSHRLGKNPAEEVERVRARGKGSPIA